MHKDKQKSRSRARAAAHKCALQLQSRFTPLSPPHTFPFPKDVLAHNRFNRPTTTTSFTIATNVNFLQRPPPAGGVSGPSNCAAASPTQISTSASVSTSTSTHTSTHEKQLRMVEDKSSSEDESKARRSTCLSLSKSPSEPNVIVALSSLYLSTLISPLPPFSDPTDS